MKQWTWSELRATAILNRVRGSVSNQSDPHADANWIIALAEQIKAERAVAVMED